MSGYPGNPSATVQFGAAQVNESGDLDSINGAMRQLRERAAEQLIRLQHVWGRARGGEAAGKISGGTPKPVPAGVIGEINEAMAELAEILGAIDGAVTNIEMIV